MLLLDFVNGEEADSWFCPNVMEKKQILGFAQIDFVSLDYFFSLSLIIIFGMGTCEFCILI